MITLSLLFTVYSLEGCLYSAKAVQLLKKQKTLNEIILVKRSEADKWKRINKMDTFPQIFTTVTWQDDRGKIKTERLLIGGYQELAKSFETSVS